MSGEPILLPKFSKAISHLYSLDKNCNAASQKQAHEYLIEFQSRNIRRKVISLHQKRRDAQSDVSTVLVPDIDTNGSSFYASLPLLFSISSRDIQRLFCAQTILHRLRRMKTNEAIDFEMENFDSPHMNVNTLVNFILSNCSKEESSQYWTEFMKFHGAQCSSFHVNLLGKVLQDYFQNTMKNSSFMMNMSSSDVEDKIKGEMALLILGCGMYFNVYCHFVNTCINGNDGDSLLQPMLETLSSAMAVVALRLRYTPASVYNNAPVSDSPIVTMIVQTFQSIAEIASNQTHLDILQTVIDDDGINQKLTTENQHLCRRTLSRCVCVSLASIPDSILGSPGGARGRLSLDPKCIMAANTELRSEQTGLNLLKEAFSFLLDGTEVIERGDIQMQILIASEKWARFVPLPLDFAEFTLSSSLSALTEHSKDLDLSFCAYLIRIFEGTALTTDQVQAAAAGMTSEADTATHQLGRKKQSSKAKKRHKERLDSVLNSGKIKRQEAEREVFMRGKVGCSVAVFTWEYMNSNLVSNLHHLNRDVDEIVNGEGPVGCICNSISACIPQFVRHGDLIENETESLTLCNHLIDALKMICSSDNISVRALTYEHIESIHKVLIECATVKSQTYFYQIAAKGICEGTLILSQKCAYPLGYFQNLADDNIEEIEIERNDVRDIIRSIVNLENSSTSCQASLEILKQIIAHCKLSIADDQNVRDNRLPHETIIHALSAPAKSLTTLAKAGNFTPDIEEIICNALDCLTFYCERLLHAFSASVPLNDTLPVSRLVCLTVASFAPFFAALIKDGSKNAVVVRKAYKCIGVCVVALTNSIIHVPELVASSSLDCTRYDIRGAFRAPGGEDHCGCIALMRIVKAGDLLAKVSLECAAQAKNIDLMSTFKEMAEVYLYLHEAEMKRPPGQKHGEGVTAKSRRVYLGALAKIGLITMHSHIETSDKVSLELKSLFQKPIDVILSSKQRTDLTQAQVLFLLCEACFDLAAFPSIICRDLFAQNGHGVAATQVLIETCLNGYSMHTTDEPSDAVIQWARLRGATIALLQSSADESGFPEFAIEALMALSNAECENIRLYSNFGSNVTSSLFHEDVIGDEILPAGGYIIAIRDAINRYRSELVSGKISKDSVNRAFSSFTKCLLQCKEGVLSSCLVQSPFILSEWEDPRPSLLEAWTLTLTEIIELAFEYGLEHDSLLHDISCETLCVCLQIIMFKRTEKQAPSSEYVEVVSVDGAQTLAMVEFFESVLRFGNLVFAKVAHKLEASLPISPHNLPNNDSMIGGGIIVAMIYRCTSGSIPPWAIEYVPSLFHALFECCGKDNGYFESILLLGSEMRLRDGMKFGSVTNTLAGYYYDTMRPKGKEEFVKRMKEVIAPSNHDKWRKLKVLVKSVCGGKKKASDFNLKPQYTIWNLDRI